jgi:hypothetical protein
MYKNCRRKITMTTNISAAAIPVRKATTASGEKPERIAIRPKTGARPRNTAEDKAAITPLLCRLLLAMTILSLSFSEIARADMSLFYVRVNVGAI